jgi:hypothetical protein
MHLDAAVVDFGSPRHIAMPAPVCVLVEQNSSARPFCSGSRVGGGWAPASHSLGPGVLSPVSASSDIVDVNFLCREEEPEQRRDDDHLVYVVGADELSN